MYQAMLWYLEIRQKLPVGSVNVVIVSIFITILLPAVVVTNNTKNLQMVSAASNVTAIVLMKHTMKTAPAWTAIKHMRKS